MENDEFKKLRKEILETARRNGSCKPGYKQALLTGNIGMLCKLLRDNWSDVTNMHRADAEVLFTKYYAVFKKEFTERDIFFNCDADHGLVFICNASKYGMANIKLSGTADAQVYGDSEVTSMGHALVYATDSSRVLARDFSSVILDGEAECVATGQSCVNAREKNKVTAQGAVQVMAAGKSVVDARQWRLITLTGEAKVIGNEGVTRNIHYNK